MSDKEIAMQLTLKAMEEKLIFNRLSGHSDADSPQIAETNIKLVANFYTAMYKTIQGLDEDTTESQS
ncbi:MAG: hypothetical protein K1W18_02870 [Oscillospiraceae bacterium]